MLAIYHTFGCKLNFAETSTLAGMLEERGVARALPGETPDFVVVNTCSVTEVADRKCRQTIRSYNRRWPSASIIVTGCYAQLKCDEAASLPGVALVAGSNQKLQIADFVDGFANGKVDPQSGEPQILHTAARDFREFAPSCSRGDRTRYFLKVQDGCDYWCTYCTIPAARGRSRSGTIPQLVEQARNVAAQGGKEIVITGVNIGDFGKGRSDSFFDLIKALDGVRGIERYRISSIEPNLLTDEIIDWCADSRAFMPHFHIPLQCGSDEVLRLMHRHYDTSLFRDKIERIRHTIPDAFIGVDLIVGARGETPELFSESKAFVESLPISRLHVFPYSERPGTRALSIDYVVAPEEKQRRDHEMLAVSDEKLRAFCKNYVGTTRPVLLEHTISDQGLMSGFTDNYLRVHVPADEALSNRIAMCTLDGLDPDTLEFNGSIAK